MSEALKSPAVWKAVVARYSRPVAWRAIWQLANTLVPYAAVWTAAYFTLQFSVALTVVLAALGGGLLIRLFIIFHDCGHGSFFKSRAANTFFGYVTGVLAFTPYHQWRWEHAIHHASAGDLDRRGVGDIWTLTVQEYLDAPRWKRLSYRLARNPIVLFLVAPLFLFLVRERLPSRKAGLRERLSVYFTNMAICGMACGLVAIFGWKAYLALQLGMMAVAGSAGVWLFYVQHQFEGVYWERGKDWNYHDAALQGSSFYKLPKILQWFSGSIGFHHIHHLSPRIPNYNLERCHYAEPLFQTVRPVTLLPSLRSLAFRLWDERERRLVGFRAARLARARARR